MAKDKSVIIYCDYLDQFEDLSDADFGAIVRAILRYNLGEGEPHFDDPMLSIVFKVIKRSVDTANAHYEEVCRKRSAARKEVVKKARERAEKRIGQNQKIQKIQKIQKLQMLQMLQMLQKIQMLQMLQKLQKRGRRIRRRIRIRIRIKIKRRIRIKRKKGIKIRIR